MVTQDQKEYYVNKILQSEIFRGKELYQKLLRYLVESAFKGAVPKEVTVARDVFHKGREFNASEDAVVRVHMHNLRNKLERYYQIEGQSDLLRIHIPKGHYRIEFIAQANTKPALKTPFRDQLVYLLSALVCLLLIFIIADKIVLSGGYVASDISRHNNKFWRYFFDNDYPTFVVIGDFLVFHEYDSRLDRSRRIQDYMINTADELDEYILKHPENWPQPWDLGELPNNSIYNIIDIYPIFRVFNQDIQIRYTSDIDIDFIKTSTGFGVRGVELDDVRLIREVVTRNIGVKASGGIRTFKDAQALIDAGATRLGTSSGVGIIEEYAKIFNK